MLFVGSEGEDGGHLQRFVAALLQIPEALVIQLGCIHTADRKHGIEPFIARMKAVGLLPEIVQDVLGNLADALRVQQRLLVLRRAQFFLILLGFEGFELWTHIVVIHLELQHLLVSNRIGDHIRMQLTAKHAGGGLSTQGVIREDWRAGKAKLTEFLELFLQVLLRFAKLAAVALIKNEHHLLAVDRQVRLAFHQIVELLDGGDDDLVVILVQIAFEARRTV